MSNTIVENINELKEFFKVNKITPSERHDQDTYRFDFNLPLRSIVEQNGTLQYNNKPLELTLAIPLDYPNSPPQITTRSEKSYLFHPHFKRKSKGMIPGIGDRYAEWVDFEKNNNEKIVDFLKRVIHSIQYDKAFIKPKIKNIGNEQAKLWYLEELNDNKISFPTGNFLKLPFEVKEIHRQNKKKFQIEHSESKIDEKNSQEILSKRKKKFVINENIPGYKPIERELKIEDDETEDFIYSCIKSESTNSYDNKKVIYVNPFAKHQLFEHIGWGNNESTINKVEQGGLLLGNVYYDKNKDIQYALVERIVMGLSAKSNSVHLEMDHNTWSEMISQVDEILEEQNNEHLNIIGWYHTHPNHLEVFMSPTDKNTQASFFNQDWHYSIVLNPHRKIYKAFNGKNADECLILFPLPKSEPSQREFTEESKTTSEIHKKKGRYVDVYYLVPFFFILLLVVFFKDNLITDIDEETQTSVPEQYQEKQSENNQSSISNSIYENDDSSGNSVVLDSSVENSQNKPEINQESTLTPNLATTVKIDDNGFFFQLVTDDTIYNLDEKLVFYSPIKDTFEVYVYEQTDSLLKFEIELNAHKKLVTQLNDSTIIINKKGNLRDDRDSVFGNLLHDFSVSQAKKKKNKFFFKFYGLIKKQVSAND